MDIDIDILKQENLRLAEQLKNAQKWMQEEVSWAQKTIAKKWSFIESIERKVYTFFPPEALSHFPSDGVENIVSSELIYKHLLEGDKIDGTWVMIWYQKVLDAMVELYITKWYRTYASKNNSHLSHTNNPLEKSLELVIQKKHILSLWRLYQILKRINKEKIEGSYLRSFHDYLKSRSFLEKALLETDFFLQLQSLVHMHVLTEKRHSWKLNYTDTLKARDICIWDFTDTNALLYILSASQSTSL